MGPKPPPSEFRGHALMWCQKPFREGRWWLASSPLPSQPCIRGKKKYGRLRIEKVRVGDRGHPTRCPPTINPLLVSPKVGGLMVVKLFTSQKVLSYIK